MRSRQSGALPRLTLTITDDERRLFLEACLPRLSDLVEVLPDGTEPAEILVTGWSSPWLGEMLSDPGTPIRYVCHLTGSIRSTVPRAFLERGGTVTNWGHLASAAVAEHALLLCLASLRNLPRWPDAMGGARSAQPTVLLGTRTLAGRSVGIHGCGAVAQALERLLRPFNVALKSYSSLVSPEFIQSVGMTPAGSLEELFEHSDVLFECEALVAQTAGSVAARQLALLPDRAVFVNVGRGELVDEAALLAEARSGRIQIALDVVQDEPLHAGHPLLGVPGALLSPHIAGPTTDLYGVIGRHALSNIERFVLGKPLESRVTVEIFDRST